ncbi:MAG: hypothetical protein A2038_01835 [Deltaproteobacteria bacterium GWA2_57_13]|nr:MAG: hypothetical protein A2038_01835 [Deltaproteobacteria bacterium GWA2_57_13]OGQ75144.1 MAG: hypothetical protein A3G40_00400 [Deltaproteobacteria bacterium RIFCSPLOWO2_12_FULL_57_22]
MVPKEDHEILVGMTPQEMLNGAGFFQKMGIGKLEFLKKRIARCQNLLGAGKFNKNGHPACGTLFACVSDEEEL